MPFKRFFYLSLAAIAAIGVVYAGLALAVIAEAYKRVENGRLASDALGALQSAQVAATMFGQVQTMDAGPPTGPPTGPDSARDVRRAVSDSLPRAREVHRDLAQRDRASLYARALARDQVLAQTWAEIEAINAAPPRVTDLGPDLVALLSRFGTELAASVASEQALLAQKRADADLSLQLLGYLAYAAALIFILSSLVVGILLKRRLDPSLSSLERGLESIRNGDFGNHVPILRDDEFGRLADILNFAATTLHESRLRDRTAREVLEQTVAERTQELSRAIHEMQSLANQRSKLLADVGHELRTPRTIIRGEAEVALRNPRLTKTEHREILSIIQTASVQLMVLLDDLTTISGECDPTLRLSLAVHGPDQIVRATMLLLNKTRRGIDVDLRAPQALGLLDPLRLQQAILVLLENAVAYSPDDTKITVSSFSTHEVWHLEVIDRGIGIGEDELGSIFNRGYRSVQAKLSRPSGLGYGLGIAATLVERQGGTLSVSSDGPRQGAKFSISLPLLPRDQAHASCHPDRRRPANRALSEIGAGSRRVQRHPSCHGRRRRDHGAKVERPVTAARNRGGRDRAGSEPARHLPP
jgi:signal transduction histidine kinase